MSPGLTIREAGLTDLKSVFAIEKESFPTPWSRWTFLAELNQSLGHFLVAGPSLPQPWALWGYIVFWLVADEMHLLNLAVHPEKRRRGVAGFLLREALRRSQALGAKAAWLEVRPSNTPALALYASFGFKEVGRRPGYYQDTREDAMLLVLEWEE
ncbi:MAG: ribosomal protein S18-alanine N-acetyltransferase [Desulfobaccales bacterium]